MKAKNDKIKFMQATIAKLEGQISLKGDDSF
jgi:hypothetical protein